MSLVAHSAADEPPLGLVALVPAAGRSRLVAARGRARRPAEPLREARRVAPMTQPALHPDRSRRPPATGARARPCASCPPTCSRRSRPSCASATAGPGFLLESVERGQQVGRYSFMAAGCEPLELDAGERLRAAAPRTRAPRRRRPRRPAAVLRRRRRLPRLRRGLHVRAERAAAARARGRRRSRSGASSSRRSWSRSTTCARRCRWSRSPATTALADELCADLHRARCPPASSRCRR